MGASEQAEMLSLGVWVLENCFYHTSISMMKDIDCVIPKRYRVLLGSVTITDYFWHIITWLRWQDTVRQSLSHTVDLEYSWPCCHYSVHSQLFVSLATATIPIGCCGISALNTFMSPPTYLSALRTALRTQSVQKMWSPYTAKPKGCTGSFFRTTYRRKNR